MLKRFYVLLFLTLTFTGLIHSMIFDNRYMPLYLKPYIDRPCFPYHSRIQPFLMHAERAFGDLEETRIPEVDGKYNLVNISDSLQDTGALDANPFRSDLQGLSNIPFGRDGKLDSQGIAFYFVSPLWRNLMIGIDFLFMHVTSRHEFFTDSTGVSVGLGDRNYLSGLREQLNQDLGVSAPLFSKTGFGDVDFFVKCNYVWPYMLKFRAINAELKLGAYAPTASSLNINNPAAVPFGGNDHWGVYVNLENQYEVRESMFASLMFRAIKRLKKTSNIRMPVHNEPLGYGASVGLFEVDPGWTFVFNPMISLEGVREGLGFTVLYTLVAHLQDKISDCRLDKSVPVQLDSVMQKSSWGIQYVSIGAFYDLDKYNECACRLPRFSLYWDIPVDWLGEISKRSLKTQSVSFSFDLDF